MGTPIVAIARLERIVRFEVECARSGEVERDGGR